MDKTSKKRWYDIALLIALFLLTSSLPFSLFIANAEIAYWLKVSLRILFLVFAYFYIKKNSLEKPRLSKPGKECFLFLPFILICFSNFFAAWIDNQTVNTVSSPLPLLKDALFYMLVSLGEELVFRVVLFSEFKKGHSFWKAVLLSSIIFALPHLLNASSWATLGMAAIQTVYSFLLGILLCFLYETSNNIILPIVLHFLFDFMNDALVGALYPLYWNLAFYLTNAVVALLLIVYFLCVCRFFFKDKRLGKSKEGKAS
jgi:membrane protease YdiL (CAAX protease family)